jgi:hypothetical protein
VRRWTGGRHPDLCQEGYATVAKSPPVAGPEVKPAANTFDPSGLAAMELAAMELAAPSFNMTSQRPVLCSAHGCRLLWRGRQALGRADRWLMDREGGEQPSFLPGFDRR